MSEQTLRSPPRKITGADFAILSSLAWTTGRLHADEEWARRESEFGARILAGPVLFSIACGLWYTSMARRFAAARNVTLLAPRRYELSFRSPAREGDELRLETTLEGIEDGSTFVLSDRCLNQRDETVLIGRRWLPFEPAP